MSNSPVSKPAEFEIPVAAGPAQLRLGDLNKTITVNQAIQLAQDVCAAVLEEVEGCIEHWTDDEGTHRVPLRNNLEESAPKVTEQAAMFFLRDAGIF